MPKYARVPARGSAQMPAAGERSAANAATKARSAKPGATNRGTTARWPSPRRTATDSARRSASGSKTTSPSVNRIHSPAARRAPAAQAWFLPSHPAGSEDTWTTSSRASSRATRSRIAPVASVERSSTATTRTPGRSCARRLRTQPSTAGASSRHGTTTVTGRSGPGAAASRRSMARRVRTPSARSTAHAASDAAAAVVAARAVTRATLSRRWRGVAGRAGGGAEIVERHEPPVARGDRGDAGPLGDAEGDPVGARADPPSHPLRRAGELHPEVRQHREPRPDRADEPLGVVRAEVEVAPVAPLLARRVHDEEVDARVGVDERVHPEGVHDVAG